LIVSGVRCRVDRPAFEDNAIPSPIGRIRVDFFAVRRQSLLIERANGSHKKLERMA
jgi:hypothetical protein